MERKTGRADYGPVPDPWPYPTDLRSSGEIGRGINPVAAATWQLAGDGQDLMVAGKIPPTLTWETGKGGSTLVSDIQKGGDIR